MLKSEKMDYNNDVYSLGVFTIILLYKNRNTNVINIMTH